MKVGFIGVGNMGGPMCRNIVKRSNHQVTVFDLNAAALKTCTDLGATAAKSVAEVTKGADVVMTSLPMPKDVEAVTLGDNGILANIGKGQTYIDLSTNAPSMVKKIGAAMAAKGIAMLDAPVSGGTVGAEAATIAIMVGGDKKVFDDALPVLQSFSANVIHMGELGTGTVAKLVNNMMAFCNAAAAAEGLMLGVTAGLDPAKLIQVISTRAAIRASSRASPNVPCRARSRRLPSRSTSRTRTCISPWSWPTSSTCRCRRDRRRTTCSAWRAAWAWAQPTARRCCGSTRRC